jgi:signal transduction histidine kinase/CheY-like chemotaxis protein
MVKVMQWVAHADYTVCRQPHARNASRGPYSGTGPRSECGAPLQLLDFGRPLVSKMPKRVHTLTFPQTAGTADLFDKNPVADQMEMIELLTGASFGAVFESSGEALVVVDVRGLIHRANTLACDLLHLLDTPITRANLSAFLSEQSAAGFISFCGRNSGLPAQRSPRAEPFDATLASGFPVRITFRAHMPGSQGLLLCLEDASIAGRPDRKSRQVQSKLLQTEKMAALGQLVSGIAHELNNPLTAIMGYAQLLLGHGLLPQQLSEASKVFQEAERARRIVKNLLYFARENKPERMRVNLNEIVERTLALRSYELKVQNIAVECELAPDLPETIGDPYQLQQVVLNLLVNAEHALLQDRGRGQVWIRTHALPGGKISLEVSDDGPGIPPEIASRIFDPFFTTKASGVGTGLGLSIVYGIVQQHGGEVTFESRPGAGVKFVMELPVISNPAAARPAAVAPLAAPAGQPSAVPAGRILVVEDEPTVAQLIVDVLREEGHQVEAVLDSQEGLTRISRTHYDLVICDLRMPRLDGPAFYAALVSAGSPVQNRIIFVTGDTLAARTLEFLEGHNRPYLAKPFLVEELKLAVNRMLVQIYKDAKSPQAQAQPQPPPGTHSGSASKT